MTANGRRIWSRFVRIARPYLTSDARWRARGLLAALLGILLAINGLNIVISYVGRDFMTAITTRQTHRVYLLALVYLAVFAVSAGAAAFSRFFELLLGLRWREWLTRFFVHHYLSSHAYFHLNSQSEVDNPDQRISEDLRTFTATTLSFLVMATNSVITIIAFTAVLWTITPWLLVAGFLYPLIGTGAIALVGHRLINLNNQQLKKEADFRFELVHVRTHAEPLALIQSEQKEEARLKDRLGILVRNYRSIISVLRNLEFATGTYNYLTQLIPVLIVVPLYMRGEVEFGVITQAAMAFSQIFNALSLVATKFEEVSTFAVVIGRLGSLQEAMATVTEPAQRPVHVTESDAPVAYDQVTLRSPTDGRLLVHNLSLELPRGKRILLTGPKGAGKSAIMLATAGLWPRGNGHITRPARRKVMFLPEQPYLVPGTLRDQFQKTPHDAPVSEERILEALRQVHLESLVERVHGLDVEQDWTRALSLGEQQLLAFARLFAVLPEFAFLDHAYSELNELQRAEIYRTLAGSGIGYISVGDRDASHAGSHDLLLELQPGGNWSIGPITGTQQACA